MPRAKSPGPALARPQVVLVTNVTGAHLEGFGSMQGIADAKAEIFGGCTPGGQAIINNDDSFADFFAEKARAAGLTVVRVSMDESTRTGADLYAENITLHRDRAEFVLQPLGEAVTVPLPGAHQVSNALMACAAVRALGVSLAPVLPRLAALKPVPGRMHIQPAGAGAVVDDTYNANPGSVRVAIDWLAAQPAPQMLVLGAMGELGPQAESLVQELGEYARQAGLSELVVMTGAAAAARGYGEAAKIAEDYQQAASWSAPVLAQGGTVLVKGSRSAGMEAVVQRLTQERTHTGGTLMLLWLAEYLAQYHSGFLVVQYITLRGILSVLTALFIAFWVGPIMIRKLQEKQVGQAIRDDGPKSHLSKAGTRPWAAR